MSFASVHLTSQRSIQPAQCVQDAPLSPNPTAITPGVSARFETLAKGASAPVRELKTADISSRHAVAAPAEVMITSSEARENVDAFDKMLQDSELPILVDFAAPWCGPCQMMTHVINKLSKRLSGAVSCVNIDTEKNPALASKYKIRALPTLMLFKDGKPLDKVEGYIGLQPLVDRVNFYLGRRMGPGRRFTPTGTVDLGYRKLTK